MTSEAISTNEGGLIETKSGIFEIRGFSSPDLVYGFSGASRGNLSYTYAAGQQDEVARDRIKLATDLGINPDKVVQMNIAQGEKIAVVSGENAFSITNNDDSLILPETDALITSDKDIALFLLTADCLPIILYDTVEKVLGLAHVSRKGALKDLPANVISKMTEEFNCLPVNMVAGIGPAIGPECYVFNQLDKDYETSSWKEFINKTSTGYGIDFVGYSVASLKALGVKVYESKRCVAHAEGFFSHKISAQSQEPRIPEKRFATLVMMK